MIFFSKLHLQKVQLTFLLLFFIFYNSIKAQDTICLKDGSKIPAIVLDIKADVVKFKLAYLKGKNILYKSTSDISYILVNENNNARRFDFLPDTLSTKPKKNFLYLNLLNLTLNCEPNLSYERRFKDKFGISLYAGYKFENFFGRAIGTSGISLANDAVRFCYQGPKVILGFKYYTRNKKYFTGLTVGGSLLQIKNKSFYGSASSYAEQINHLNSTRKDLDVGITFGRNNLFKKLQVYVTFGLRNIWVTTTCNDKPGSPSVGGELAPFTNPVINGYMGYMLYQVGINYVFGSKIKPYTVRIL